MTLTANSRRKIVILGGGSAGIRVAAQIFDRMRWPNVTLIEPSTQHMYEPFLPLIGVGLVSLDAATRHQSEVIPQDAQWVRQAVKKLDLKKSNVVVDSGRAVPYEFLVVAEQAELQFNDAKKGLADLIGEGGICSVHTPEYAANTAEQLAQFSGGDVVFLLSQSNVGSEAALRFLFLLDEHLRKRELCDKGTLTLVMSEEHLFGVEETHKAFASLLAERNIKLHVGHGLAELDAEKQEVTFAKLNEKGKPTDEVVTLPYGLMHITPPMAPSKVLAKSKLAARAGSSKGWLSVDANSLQHKKQKNVFGIGDTLALPLVKTDFALREQAPIVAHNLVATLQGKGPGTFRHYDGASRCLLGPGHGAERAFSFRYDDEGKQSILADQQSAGSMWVWLRERYIQPSLYWRGMTRIHGRG